MAQTGTLQPASGTYHDRSGKISLTAAFDGSSYEYSPDVESYCLVDVFVGSTYRDTISLNPVRYQSDDVQYYELSLSSLNLTDTSIEVTAYCYNYTTSRVDKTNKGTFTLQFYSNCYWDSSASSSLSASESIAGSNVTLSWNTSKAHGGYNNPISKYYVYRRERSSSSASWGAWGSSPCAQSTSSPCSVTAPTTVGHQYQFRVQIIGANGYNSTGYAESGTLTAKGTITNFNVTSITSTRTSAVIEWSQPTYDNTQPAFSYTCSVSGDSVAISGRSATVTGLTKGRSYDYSITASYDGVTATITGSFSTKSVATVKYCTDGNSFTEYEVWYCEDGTSFVSMDVYVSDGGPYYLCSF